MKLSRAGDVADRCRIGIAPKAPFLTAGPRSQSLLCAAHCCSQSFACIVVYVWHLLCSFSRLLSEAEGQQKQQQQQQQQQRAAVAAEAEQ